MGPPQATGQRQRRGWARRAHALRVVAASVAGVGSWGAGWGGVAGARRERSGGRTDGVRRERALSLKSGGNESETQYWALLGVPSGA